MDTDSYIYSPLAEDPFITMHRVNASYGYRNVGTEPQEMAVDMWDFVEEYIEDHREVKRMAEENDFRKDRWGPR